MAELVGVVASGISIGTFAAQITSSFVKLKTFWDEVRDIPEDIQDLIEELEDLYYLLTDLEEDRQRNPVSSLILDSTTTSRCLSRCKQGADQLKELTDELNSDIQKRSKLGKKWVSTKVVFKKERLERYKKRLERAIRLLSLSHQLYTR